jgi:Mrp family chromosome partitioning ATPase
MDRIRIALDLARQERGELTGFTEEPLRSFDATVVPIANAAVSGFSPGTRPSRPNRLREAGEGRRGGASSSPGNASAPRSLSSEPVRIQYSRTKVFSPSPALLEANRILEPSGSSPGATAFRVLRTQVLQRMKERQWRSVAVVSPGSDDGKTTTAINLAVSLANDHQHTVLLVEFDLKRPTFADKLGIVPEMGVDDLLRGTAQLEDCLYHPDGFERLVILPARATLDDSSEVLAGPWCRQVVMELRSRYPDRLLVFDLPPVLGADDALAFMPLVECALVVVAEGATPRDDLLRCMELLRNTPVVGTVLNRATDVASAYGR